MLLIYKYFDYLFFKEVIVLMKEGKYFYLEGINRIVFIKVVLNRGKIFDNLSLFFFDLEFVLSLEFENRNM